MCPFMYLYEKQKDLLIKIIIYFSFIIMSDPCVKFI